MAGNMIRETKNINKLVNLLLLDLLRNFIQKNGKFREIG